MEIRVFTHNLMRETCEPELFKLLVERFRQYKANGTRHPTFGRDVPYDRPPDVRSKGLAHIHIKDATSNWDAKYLRVYDMKSNTALIYCQGFWNPDRYLIITYIQNAHDYYGGTEAFVRSMGEIAEKFREKN